MTLISANHGDIQGDGKRGWGFTLIEIMVVVAIMGIIMMTGVPPFVRVMRQEGMRKALKDVVEACEKARADAVMEGKASPLVVSPMGHSIRGGKFSGMIPNDVTILSVGVNFVELSDAEQAQAMFYPTGISDEFEITLQGANGEIRQVTLDIVTGTPVVSSVR